MELVVAPIVELRPRMTHFFEELVSGTLERGDGSAPEPHTLTCGLTGGSAALIFLGALREADVDWSRITLYWGDERAVAPDSSESNYGLAEQMLLKPLGAKAANAIRMLAEVPDLAFAARQYAEPYRRRSICSFSEWVTMGTFVRCFLATPCCKRKGA